MARLMLVKHKRKFATFDACLHCCWVFLVSNASFDMRFASFIAVFRVLSSPVHNTQIDLLVFIGCGYDDKYFLSNDSVSELHCIHWIRIFGMKPNDDDTEFHTWLLNLEDALFLAQKFTLWKLIKYVNRNLRCHFCKRYILPRCNTGRIRFFGTFWMHRKSWKCT